MIQRWSGSVPIGWQRRKRCIYKAEKSGGRTGLEGTQIWGGVWGFLSGSVVKNLPVMQKPQETQVRSLVWEDPLEEEMVTHSSILAWRIPWTGEPGGLQSMGSQRVGHKWLSMHSMRQPDRVQEGGLTLDWWWEEEEEKGKQSLLEQHWKQWVCLFQGGYLSKASVVAKRLTKRKDEKRSTSRSDSGKVMVISQ